MASAGNQIFITVRRGKEYPPRTVDVRVKYEGTVGQIKVEASKKLGLPLEKLQLFWQDRELTPAFDDKTLLEMNLHTGFSLRGYDLTEEPDYWPAVESTPEGLRIVASPAA